MKAFLPAKAALTAALTVAVSSVALAQTQPPSGGPEPSTPPTAVPVDGGAALLLAGGVAYGLKKLRRRRSA
ncbi:PID-CTERM protein-sorting domain-containing protein [uncultured Hymenobacter sp.]|uniref:PID-CTERM protein-sorting domain-containing protein n=1 Tax=uncultured Hymenobacter sp. TaxID=170016 RepID=UPI0035CB138E